MHYFCYKLVQKVLKYNHYNSQQCCNKPIKGYQPRPQCSATASSAALGFDTAKVTNIISSTELVKPKGSRMKECNYNMYVDA